MSKSIKVFIKEPGKALYEKIIPYTIKAMSDIVGGVLREIKTEQGWKTFSLLDAKEEEKPFNFYLFGEYYYGTVVFVGTGKTGTTDMPYDMADFLGLTNNLNGGNK